VRTRAAVNRRHVEELFMKKALGLIAAVSALLVIDVARAQHPILDAAAEKVVEKYQRSTCEQLWEQRGKPKPPREQEVIQMLRDDPQMRREFLNKIAAPVANKMFECGLVP
jgi:hypothetical protein